MVWFVGRLQRFGTAVMNEIVVYLGIAISDVRIRVRYESFSNPLAGPAEAIFFIGLAIVVSKYY